MNKPRDLPELYLNRELGQLAFNRRVLAQAENRATPLLERLRFLCIVSSNLDEFFEIRVSGLKAEIEAGSPPIGPDRMRPDQVFAQVARGGARARRGAVPAAQRGGAAGARGRGHPLPAARPISPPRRPSGSRTTSSAR